MSNVVFMVNLPETKKPGRSNSYQYSERSWKFYCDRTDSELFVLTERIWPEDRMNANWHKIYALQLLEANGIDYDKVLIVDGDTIVHPMAPNIFDVVGDKFYAVHNDGSYDWMLRSMENYSHHMFNGFTFPFTRYFNSGFIVINRRFKGFFDDAIQFYTLNQDRIRAMQQNYGVGTDQPVLNFLVHSKIPDELEILPYEWNMQELPRREVLNLEMTFVHYGWVYHFNGIHPDFKVLQADNTPAVEQWMSYVYTQLYSDIDETKLVLGIQ